MPFFGVAESSFFRGGPDWGKVRAFFILREEREALIRNVSGTEDQAWRLSSTFQNDLPLPKSPSCPFRKSSRPFNLSSYTSLGGRVWEESELWAECGQEWKMEGWAESEWAKAAQDGDVLQVSHLPSADEISHQQNLWKEQSSPEDILRVC
jgi:hypothetical protein